MESYQNLLHRLFTEIPGLSSLNQYNWLKLGRIIKAFYDLGVEYGKSQANRDAYQNGYTHGKEYSRGYNAAIEEYYDDAHN